MQKNEISGNDVRSPTPNDGFGGVYLVNVVNLVLGCTWSMWSTWPCHLALGELVNVVNLALFEAFLAKPFEVFSEKYFNVSKQLVI